LKPEVYWKERNPQQQEEKRQKTYKPPKFWKKKGGGLVKKVRAIAFKPNSTETVSIKQDLKRAKGTKRRVNPPPHRPQ